MCLAFTVQLASLRVCSRADAWASVRSTFPPYIIRRPRVAAAWMLRACWLAMAPAAIEGHAVVVQSCRPPSMMAGSAESCRKRVEGRAGRKRDDKSAVGAGASFSAVGLSGC